MKRQYTAKHGRNKSETQGGGVAFGYTTERNLCMLTDME